MDTQTGASCEAGAEYVGEQYLGSDRDNSSKPLDVYTVVDLVLHRNLGDWRLTARMNNLFDEEYSETGATSFAGDGFNPPPGATSGSGPAIAWRTEHGQAPYPHLHPHR